MRKRSVLICAAILALALQGCASTGNDGGDGSTFPESVDSIQLLIPFSAGGSTDTIARLVAPLLSAQLDTPVQVVNKPEGNGQVGLAEIAEGPTDGSLLGATNLPSAMISYLDPNTSVRYNRGTFVPVGSVAGYGELVVVSASSPYRTLDDLIKAGQSESLNLAAGAVDDLLSITKVETAIKTTFNKVPFEGGSADKVTALLGRKVDVITAAPSAVLPNVESGEFRPLATLGAQRLPSFPDVPTLAELGFDVREDVVAGYSLPKGTQAAIVKRYEQALKAVTDDPGFAEKIKGIGFGVGYLGTAEFADLWNTKESQAKPILDTLH
ncbi:ABC transporter substrate-binding protein [Acrocarpospora pleiomorpha]|uniref:ABC transporter substrate-binding protein n=1 Tax=Acrocarpospora pleiomorpha TaxID=90975 RepID=A0A5M3X820_9ACTN|nr:tripartite tricarboxylate transporter substrate binding protein [Acrocarpospora pleiomorpha]GES17254.1 ABC transporter substrate-binding protein [Acrocarpospora pleiomorpha]